MLRFPTLFVFLIGGGAGSAQNIAGVWHATVLNKASEEVAFDLELTRNGDQWQGSLVNGSDRQTSTWGSLEGSKLRLRFDYWDAVLEAELANNEWNGSFTRQYRREILVRKLHAQRQPVWVARHSPQANFSGEWLLQVDEEGKLSVYRALVKQKANRAEATLVEVSGDSGLLVGIVENRRMLVSRFDGIRATRFDVSMKAGGSLEGLLDSRMKVTGARVEQSRLEAPEASHYTRMKSGEQRFRFAYPDLDGKLVSSEDERFRGKVLLVTITGSWCPNCHDEAPLLRELYARYREQGLEIVALGFEYTGETERDLRQLRLFRDKYKLTFPILLAGATDEAQAKLPQLENFAGYPTAIYVGRDGTVRAIHAGFDGPATGARHGAVRAEMESAIRKLVSEK